MGRIAALSMGFLFTAGGCGDDSLQTAGNSAKAGCECRLDTVIQNLALCASPTTAFAATHVYSTFWNSVEQKPDCEPWRDPQPVPAMPWSNVSISSRCQGSGQICITMKAGNVKSPSADDCVLTSRCTSFDYTTPGQSMDVAPLGAWVAESSECASRYEQVGGYLELTAPSDTLGCGDPNEVTRQAICPVSCSSDPTADSCSICGGPTLMPSF